MPTSAAKVLGWTMKKPFKNYGKKYASDGFTAYWLVELDDRQPEDPVLIFCHGGGFVFPLSLPQVWLLTAIVRAFPSVRLNVLILDYSLSPEHRYPTQIEEIASLYRHLLDVEACENIVLAGESCGGNLILALLAHLKHGFPTASPTTSKCKDTAVKGAILISPWVNLAIEAVVHDADSSYVKNAHEDILNTERLCFWANEYCPDKLTRQTSPWVSPVLLIKENIGFWENVLPARTLITWGEEELMKDDVARFASMTNISNAFEVPNGVHVDVLFQSKSPVYDKIIAFLEGVFEAKSVDSSTSTIL
ncbi:Say1p [Sugiyamaella lignohabitans]|uniref:Say1p n=1 Tax=Sugiyamaella lignohabitans TaxID=796027 RepID=A0A167C281_9ASCO|nr:Say1p [Sugiyamaella lignohabitans]ANB11130.1 Say1p [Sugiyamaella lignohabitans]